MAYVFNHSTQRIQITSPQVQVLIQDLVNVCRIEEESIVGIADGRIISAAGKEALGSGVQVGITATLLEGWQIEFWAGNYTATLTGGNLVAVSGDAIAYVVGGPQVEITLSAAATITSGTGSTAPTAEEITNAMMQRIVEGSLTVEGCLRVLLAVAVGDGSALTTTPTFKSLDGAKTRVAGTLAAGGRTRTTLDPT